MKPCMTFALGLALAAPLVVTPASLPAQAPPADAVADLRNAFHIPQEQLANPTPAFVKAYRKILQAKADKVRTIGDLEQALALEEWRRATFAPLPQDLKQTYADLRQDLGQRFFKQLKTIAETGSVTQKVAMATMMQHLDPSMPPLRDQDAGGFGRSLTPLVEILLADKDESVRLEGLRALARILPDPAKAGALLQKAMGSRSAPERSQAARAAGDFMKSIVFMQQRSRDIRFRSDIFQSAEEVVRVSGRGLKDDDDAVKIHCLGALKTAADAVKQLVPEPFSARDFPPPELLVDEFQRQDVRKILQREANDQQEWNSVLKDFLDQAEALAAILDDKNSSVVFAGVEALDVLAELRLRLHKRADSLPRLGADAEPAAKAVIRLDAVFQKPMPNLIKTLAHPESKVRVVALYVLEHLQQDAAPALEGMVKAAADANAYVRWGAARALSRLGGPEAAKAVSALAGLLADDNKDVRLSAALGLEGFGPRAASGALALGETSAKGDPETRRAALLALKAIGPKGKAAIPGVLKGLDASEALVRVAAAETLGVLGPLETAALDRLRSALADPVAEVRQAASRSILANRAATEQ